MNMNEPLHVRRVRGELRHDEPMARHVSWRAGGRADRFFVPADLEDLAAFLPGQHSDSLPNAPSGRAQHLQSADRGHDQCNATTAYHADALGKTVECLEFESGKINTLKLFGGVGHEEAFSC